MAGQHEMIVDNLNATILKELNTLLIELKQERKKVSPHLIQKLTGALDLTAVHRHWTSVLLR